MAIFLLLLKLRGRKEGMPHGPFLAAGAVLALVAAKDFDWYLDLLG